MKVAIVNSFYPPWRGGAETYVSSIARGLAKKGHAVTVLCGNEPLAPGSYVEESVLVRRQRIVTRIYGTPLMPGLPKAISVTDADILHANFPSPYIAFVVSQVSTLKRIPAVLTWHNDLPRVSQGARFLVELHDHAVLPYYLRAYRYVIATSEVYRGKSRILPRLGERVKVVPHGVDTDRFNPCVDGERVRRRLFLEDTFTLIFVGALTKWHVYKGLDVLIEAMRILTQLGEFALVVVGEGIVKNRYLEQCRRLALSDRVHFVGDVADSELPEYYAAADVSVLPSKDMSEGFGLTLLEANASGKPVVASNVGGIPSVIQNGCNGILVPPCDPQSLARAILKLRDDSRLLRKLGRNGRRIAELQDWRITVMKTEEVYLEALNSS